MRELRILVWVACWWAGCHDGSTTSLAGTVTIEGESDFSGTRVELAGPSSGSTTTASDGSYHFDGLVAGGRYAVVASAGGTLEGSLSASASAGDGQFPPLSFHAVGGIAGTVTRAGAQSGNQGILVSAEGSSGAALSDDSGGFEIDGLAPGSYQLDALAAGFVPGGDGSLVVTRGKMTQAPQIDLVPAPDGPSAPASLRGFARLTGASSPISGDAGGITVSLGSLTATTAADGSFLLANPPSGTFPLAFDQGAYHERVPAVLSLAGAAGFYLDSQLSPLDASTLVLPRGTRVQSAAVDELILSPDGATLFYRVATTPTGNAMSDGTLMSAPVAGGAPTLIAANVPIWWQLSADGKQLIYGTRNGSGGTSAYQLHSRPVAGGATVDLLPGVPLMNVFNFTFLPGAVLVADPVSNTLDVVPLSGAAPTHLPSGFGAYSYLASPAGDELIGFANCMGNLCDLVRQSVAGGSTTLLTAVTEGGLLATPGWDHVAFCDQSQVHVVNLANGQAASYDGGQLLAVTSDHVLYTSTTNLMSAPSDGGDPALLSSSFVFGRVSLSPGGTLVYFQSGVTAQRIPVGGGAAEPLTGYVFFQFSPGGKWVELLGAGTGFGTTDFALSPAEGGPITQIAPSTVRLFEEFQADRLAFTQDESQVLYLADDGNAGQSGTVVMSDVANPSPRPLAYHAIGLDGLSPDGSTVLYYTSADGVTLFSAPTDGSSPPLALLDQAFQSPYASTRLRAFFTAGGQVAGVSRNHPTPFSFQDGLYLLSPR